MKSFKVTYPKEGVISDLLLTPLGKRLYRLEQSEMFLEDPLYFHDVIEAKQNLWGDLKFQKLVERSGLKNCVFILSQKVASSEELQALLRRVENAGGAWEIVFGGVFITHLPPASTLDAEKEIGLL